MRLYVECYPDEILVRTLGARRRQVRHAGCKGEVLNRLRRQQAGVGLVDEDPQAAQPSELGNYRQMDRSGSLVLLARLGSAPCWLIVICPSLEEWLYERAAACRIKPEDYGLPGSAQELKKIPRYERRAQFQEFLHQLSQSDGQMRRLQQWLLGNLPGKNH